MKSIEISDETARLVARHSAASGLSEAKLVAKWAYEHDEAPIHDSAPFERWLLEQVVPGHRESIAVPASGIPADRILPRLKARRMAE